MLATMDCWQCLAWAQYSQIGLVSFTTMSNVTPDGETVVGMKPLLKPFCRG
jgi:hypothetical protein